MSHEDDRPRAARADHASRSGLASPDRTHAGFVRGEVDSLVPPAPADTPAGRRGFLVGAVGTGFAAAVAPVGALRAQVIRTDAQGLTAGEVRIPVKDGQMAAYRAQPAGRTGLPTVLVVHEVFGVHEHIQDVCRRLAKAGYLAVAPQLFARQGDPSRYQAVAEIASEIVSKVADAQVMADLDAAAAWAGGNGGDSGKLGITGFCWGGRIVWMYSAHQPRLKAGVAWYGRLTTAVTRETPTHPHDVAEKLNAPVLGLYGGDDPGIPLQTVEDMRTRLSFGGKAAEASEIVVYPDAPHAFNADYRPTFRKAPAEDGWKRMQAWFARWGVA